MASLFKQYLETIHTSNQYAKISFAIDVDAAKIIQFIAEKNLDQGAKIVVLKNPNEDTFGKGKTLVRTGSQKVKNAILKEFKK